MATRIILLALAIVFLVAAVSRRPSGDLHARLQRRTWLLVAAIFGVVSAWLWYRS